VEVLARGTGRVPAARGFREMAAGLPVRRLELRGVLIAYN